MSVSRDELLKPGRMGYCVMLRNNCRCLVFLTRTENEWKELNLLLILKELNIGGWFMARVWLR